MPQNMRRQKARLASRRANKGSDPIKAAMKQLASLGLDQNALQSLLNARTTTQPTQLSELEQSVLSRANEAKKDALYSGLLRLVHSDYENYSELATQLRSLSQTAEELAVVADQLDSELANCIASLDDVKEGEVESKLEN